MNTNILWIILKKSIQKFISKHKKTKPNFISLLLNKDLKTDNKREFNSNYIINISNEMMMVIGKNPEGIFKAFKLFYN
jgi:hypothetical protein